MNCAVRRCLAAGSVLAATYLGAVAYAPVAAAGPVRGSIDRHNPSDLPAGDSTDRLGNGKDAVDKYRYYRVQRHQPDSTLYFGAVMHETGYGYGGFDVAATARSNTCFSDSAYSARRGQGVISLAGDVSSACRNDTSATVELERVDLPEMTRVTQPAAMLLRVTEVPVPRNLAVLPTSLPEVRPDPITPADTAAMRPGGITDPAPIRSGQSVRSSIGSGAVPQVFAVDVGWGQWLQTQADVASSRSLVDVKERQPQFGVTVLSPTLDTVGDSSTALTGSDSQDSVSVVTRPVVYKSYNATGGSSHLAGRHLVVVWFSPDALSQPVEAQYTLSVRVGGEVTGTPDFGDQQPAPRHPLRPWAIGLGVTGVALLAAAGGVWVASKRHA